MAEPAEARAGQGAAADTASKAGAGSAATTEREAEEAGAAGEALAALVGQRTTLLGRYGRPPAAIEAASLAQVEARLGERLPTEPVARAAVVRLVYAAGDLELAAAARLHPRFGAAALAALQARRPVVVDVRMVAVGVESGPLARLGTPLDVAVSVPRAAALAARAGTTRTAAGMALLAPRWAGGIVAVGNAPTALLALLDLVDAGWPPPAAIVGLPVGFVAAAEAKAELARRDLPYLTLVGTRGGSALAAAVLNALGRAALAALQ